MLIHRFIESPAVGNPLEGLLDKYGLLYKFHGERDICEVMALE